MNIGKAKDVVRILNELENGERVTIQGRSGWEIVIEKTKEGFDLIHRNPEYTGPGETSYKFFEYTTVSNPYGAGMIVQEPTLGFPCRDCGVEVDGTIVGALILDSNGKIVERFSWSNLVYVKKGNFTISQDGLLEVNEEGKGYLRAIFLADKNRIRGYVGVFGPNKPDEVKVLEMETLILDSLK